MAAKNAAGKQRVAGATVLMSAIYRFAAAPTREAVVAVLHVLLGECDVLAFDEKNEAEFLLFVMVDVWQMASKTLEVPVPNDQSAHLCRGEIRNSVTQCATGKLMN